MPSRQKKARQGDLREYEDINRALFRFRAPGSALAAQGKEVPQTCIPEVETTPDHQAQQDRGSRKFAGPDMGCEGPTQVSGNIFTNSGGAMNFMDALIPSPKIGSAERASPARPSQGEGVGFGSVVNSRSSQ